MRLPTALTFAVLGCIGTLSMLPAEGPGACFGRVVTGRPHTQSLELGWVPGTAATCETEGLSSEQSSHVTARIERRSDRVWLVVSIAASAPSGSYAGQVRIRATQGDAKVIPLSAVLGVE